MTGLAVVGAGAAGAAIAPAPTAAPAGIEAPQALMNADVPQVQFVAMDDDWSDTYWDDVSYQSHDDWSDTYWDD